ncbi:hypothetical protein FRC07_013886, partial [Ceratobasidium sp. 392]
TIFQLGSHMEVVKQLLLSQSALERAASDFLGQCTALKAVVVPSLTSTPGQAAFENLVDTILCVVNRISSTENLVHESHAALNGVLNKSMVRVPINKLPPGTLSQIFSFIAAYSSCCPEADQRDTLIDISQVCLRWREVATNTRVLWSHIDINFSRFPAETAICRAEMLLNRCRNIPIHIHLDGGLDDADSSYVPNILNALQPHAGLLNTLEIAKTRLYRLVCGLFTLLMNDGTTHLPKILSVVEIDVVYSQEGLHSPPWDLLHGLTVLELCILQVSVCPDVNDIAKILSSSPALSTLRLQYLETSETPLDSLVDHPVIPLPQLRQLDIMDVPFQVVLPLLSKLIPGVLELDVRLDADYLTEDDEMIPSGQPFLARSNVVSLSINGLTLEPGQRASSFFACVPRLRVLCLDGTTLCPEVLRILETTISGTRPERLPSLQTLCLNGYSICSSAANWLGRVGRTRRLRNLALMSCTYPSTFTPPPDGHGESVLQSVHERYEEIPQSMMKWLSKQVTRLMVGEGPKVDEGVYHGINPFVGKH